MVQLELWMCCMTHLKSPTQVGLRKTPYDQDSVVRQEDSGKFSLSVLLQMSDDALGEPSENRY